MISKEKINEIIDKILILKKETKDENGNIIPNIVTINNITKALDCSLLESTFYLNNYIIKKGNLEQYILFIQFELKDNNDNLYKIIIPSTNKKVIEIFNDKTNLLSFSIYGFTTFRENIKLPDFSAFVGEPRKIQRFNPPEKKITEVCCTNNESCTKTKINSNKEDNNNKVKTQKNSPKKQIKNEKEPIPKKEKLIIISDAEEEVYGGYIPLNQEKMELEDIKSDSQKEFKSEQESKQIQNKRNKKNQNKDNNLRDNSQENKRQKKLKKDFPSIEEKNEANNENKEKMMVEKVKKKIIQETYKDEEGYLHTVDKEIEEKVMEEQSKPKINLNNQKGEKKQAKKENPKEKKVKQGAQKQKSMFDYFK